MTIIRYIVVIFISIFQGACASEIDNFDKAKDWFNINQREVTEIKDTLLQYPNIKRVDESLGLKFTPVYGEFSKQDSLIYQTLIEKNRRLGIKNIAIVRTGNSKKGKLIAISYTLYSRGFIPSGYAVSVEYILSSQLIERNKKEGVGFESLNASGWYVIEYIN